MGWAAVSPPQRLARPPPPPPVFRDGALFRKVVNATSGLDLILVRGDLWPWPTPDPAIAAPPYTWCMEEGAMTPDELSDPLSRAFPATLEQVCSARQIDVTEFMW